MQQAGYLHGRHVFQMFSGSSFLFSSTQDERQGELQRIWLIDSYMNGNKLILIFHTPLHNL